MIMAFVGLEPSLGESVIHLVLVPSSLITVKNDFYSTDYRVRSFYMFPNGDKLIGTRTGLFFICEKTGEIRSYSLEKNFF